jgi:type IV secretion system protein VirB4
MMRTDNELREIAAAQIPVGEHLPFSSHVTPEIIKLKKGAYITTWRLDGIPFTTADDEDLDQYSESLNNLVKALGGGSFALWTHRIRRPVKERLSTKDYKDAFCAEFANAYYQSFDKHSQMATELYLTLVYTPIRAKAFSFLKRLAPRGVDTIRHEQEEDIGTLQEAARQVEASLKRYEPDRLSTYTKDEKVYSRFLSFLGYLCNGVWEEIRVRNSRISNYLPAARLFFGDKNGIAQIRNPGSPDKFAGFLDFQEYPESSTPTVSHPLFFTDAEFIETNSFRIMNRRDAVSALKMQQGHLQSSSDAAAGDIAAMDEAIESVTSGQMEMGEYHYSLAIFGPSVKAVSDSMADARARMQDGPGFRMSVVDAIPECAWFAQMPGNWHMRPREATLTSQNFTHLSPFHNFARGKPTGNPWGDALMLFQTPNRQPYYFNFHTSPDDKDSTDEKYPGNTSIIGTTGAGKTTLEMALLAMATKYKGFRCVFFDKDRGVEIGIRAMGGKYFAIKRGEPTGFNPFQLPPNETNIQFCEKLVRQLVSQQETGVARGLTASEEHAISQAVRTVMSEKIPLAMRRLAMVDQSLPNVGDDSLRARLRKWIGNGPLGWVLDNPKDLQDFSTGSIFGYDYTEFLDDPVIRTPVMMYLLHITESLINGSPFIYFMEEFWKPLQDAYFTDFALNKQKTIRKQNGLGVFVTQSPSDVLTSPIGKTMVEQCVTQIFLPNPRADHDDYVLGFKTTEQEYRIIKGFDPNSRQFLVKQGHRSAVVKFDLGGMTQILDVISGTTDKIELLDEIRKTNGDDPNAWLPVFHAEIAARRAARS